MTTEPPNPAEPGLGSRSADSPLRLGPLGKRLLVAFVLVALSSVVVLTVATLVGTSRGLAAGEQASRDAAAARVASAAGAAYSAAGGWEGADLRAADLIATDAGSRLVVRDTGGMIVRAPEGEAPGQVVIGQGSGRGAVVAPVTVDGQEVGSVRLGFGAPVTNAAQRIAWTWIIVAAVAALVMAVLVSWFVTRRISRPLVRLTDLAVAFAAGDRQARPAAEDLSAPGEIGELARAFDLTADAVATSEAARRAMAGDIAHELRTPLAVLQAGLEELRDGYLEPDRERLAALHAQSVRLGRVVGDLAALSSAEAAALSMRRQRVDLGDLVAAAVAAARPGMESTGLKISVTIRAGVVVFGDADRLHQVVGNLLSNATRYCRSGDSVTVSVARQGGRAEVVVADTGPGIPAEDLSRVFDRLWRGRADLDSAGSGIGLAVVKELVVAHGGVVAAQSEGASGSRFTVRLPLAQL